VPIVVVREEFEATKGENIRVSKKKVPTLEAFKVELAHV